MLTTAIDKYIFVTIKKRFDDLLRVGYTQTEMTTSVDEIKHELIREAFRKTGILRGVEVTTMGDIPSTGSGLGSSSTVTVGALHAMYTHLGHLVTSEQLAREACEIEIDLLKKPIGIQDQYIVAYGGLRFMEFSPGGEVSVERIDLDPAHIRQLNSNLLLFYTGMARSAEHILSEQKDNINQRLAVLREMKAMAYQARDHLIAGEIDQIGELLHQSWLLKKQLANKISNGQLDAIYETARKAGALGGKVTGAGGGGFLLFYCPCDRQEELREALYPLQELPFNLEADGSKVIFNYRR